MLVVQYEGAGFDAAPQSFSREAEPPQCVEAVGGEGEEDALVDHLPFRPLLEDHGCEAAPDQRQGQAEPRGTCPNDADACFHSCLA